MLLLMSIAASTPPHPALTSDIEAAFALTGLSAEDLSRPFSGPGLDGPRRMAADPLALTEQALQLADDMTADDPGDALRTAWHMLGVAVEDRPPLDGALADHLTRRRDAAAFRGLDPDVQLLLAALTTAADRLQDLQGAPPASVQDRVLPLLATPGSPIEIASLVSDAGASKADLAPLSLALLERLLQAPTGAAGWPDSPTVVSTDVGRLWIGSHGDDDFHAPFLAVLDPGGNDRYLGDGATQPLLVTLDLGGDDVYRDLASTPGGVTLQLDRAGDDLYDDDAGAFGSGLWGCSVLADMAGDDAYRAGPWGLGVGLWGVGLLFEGDGDDIYRVSGPGQGVGGPGGVGAVVDARGDDVYIADVDRAQGHGFGVGPTVPGGIGALIDRAGHDTYRAAAWSQGSGAWRGAGLAVDLDGDDRWSATGWSQGAGAHEGVGSLTDLDGHDRYAGTYGVQGAAHDRGVGW